MASFEPRTLVDIVRRHALERGDACAYRFLRREVEVERLTFAELDRVACRVARLLEGRTGQRALLLFAPGLDFVKAFIGCWFAGVVPVPCAPPVREHDVQRVLRIAKDAGISLVLSASDLPERVRSEFERIGALSLRTQELIDVDIPWTVPMLSEESIALLQYTSGSTGDPKGVVVSHGNLLRNERLIQQLFGHDARTRVAGWLPLYHDMGLIGNVLQPLYLGREVTLMSPVEFVMSPMSWLRMISKYRVTTSGAPNFAYELCANAATADEVADLDLSSWRVAYNGAEPIRKSTLQTFADAFAPAGFRREAFLPCYGLAEATLLVSGAHGRSEPTVVDYDLAELARGRAQRAANERSSIPLVSCGSVALGLTVKIVDPETRRASSDGQVGEIWISGPSVARGYWQRQELTADVFNASIEGLAGTWLRTGDLGFFENGELYVAGRIKDLLIVRGRNHYPQDLEQTCWESHPSLRAGCAAAFMVESDGEETLVITQEVSKQARSERIDLGEITDRVRARVARMHGLSLHRLVLVRPGQVPKTSSGKVRRAECRRLYLETELKLFGDGITSHFEVLPQPRVGRAQHPNLEENDV